MFKYLRSVMYQRAECLASTLLRRNCAANRSTRDNTNTNRLNFLLLRRNSVSGNWTLDFWLLRGKQKGQSLTVSEGGREREREKGDVSTGWMLGNCYWRDTVPPCQGILASLSFHRLPLSGKLASKLRMGALPMHRCASVDWTFWRSLETAHVPSPSFGILYRWIRRRVCQPVATRVNRVPSISFSLYHFPLERRFLPFLFGSRTAAFLYVPQWIDRGIFFTMGRERFFYSVRTFPRKNRVVGWLR